MASLGLADGNLKRSSGLPGWILPRSFFEHRPELVAPRLLGKLLVHRTQKGVLAGRIVEVEAYLGPHNHPPDAAAHSHRGPTPRNLVLFGHAGYAYVYSIYGQYFCMNVSCETEGQAGCLLIRALEPVVGAAQMAHNRGLDTNGITKGKAADRVARQLTSGPSRLCQALEIVRASHNGLDLTDPKSHFQIRDDGFQVNEALLTPRIGINPSNPALDWPLRFAVPGHPCVSGPRSLTGRRIFIH
jgi:DNA-3-methyladenine glycosylase